MQLRAIDHDGEKGSSDCLNRDRDQFEKRYFLCAPRLSSWKRGSDVGPNGPAGSAAQDLGEVAMMVHWYRIQRVPPRLDTRGRHGRCGGPELTSAAVDRSSIDDRFSNDPMGDSSRPNVIAPLGTLGWLATRRARGQERMTPAWPMSGQPVLPSRNLIRKRSRYYKQQE